MVGNLFKRILAVALAVLLLAVSITANADDIDGLKSEKEQIEERLEEAKEKLEKNEADVAAKEEYKKVLTEKLDNLSKETYDINSEIDEINISIKEQDKILADAEENISDRMEIFRQRLKTIYMTGETTYIEVLFGAKSFSDCLDMMVLLNAVSKQDRELIDGIEKDMEYITSVKKELLSYTEKLNEKQTELKDKQTEINLLVEENQQILDVLYVESEQARDELDLNNAELISLENNIAEYYAEQKRLAEEQKRLEEEKKKQEEEQKKQEEKNSDTDSETETDTDTGSDTSTDSALDSSTDTSESDSPSYEDEYTGTGTYVWPVPGFYYLSSEWNEDRQTYNHGAIDIAGSGIQGASVVAANSGTVIFAYDGCPHDYGKTYSCGCGGGYGNYVMVDHGDGRSTLYAHLSRVDVTVGQAVSAGQQLGAVGSTGHSTGPHLHFETRLFGEKYNPMTEYN